MSQMTPREIVSELDRYIVGQRNAKRAVAVALRNRWRRQQVAPELREEIAPKNIILIGPTGVGKTEIARRLARLAQAPFVKVEASKFTEVGYVGRDVESMIRDLVDLAINQVREEEKEKVTVRARGRSRSRSSSRSIDTAVSARSRTIESTSRPTYPTSVNFDASTLMNGAPARRASRRAISVLPTPVGPISMMFFGAISSRIGGCTCCRRQRFRNATATARFAAFWPTM